MPRMAFLFPGQGSQKVGMGQELFSSWAPARAIFEEADARLGFPLSQLCFAGPAAELQRTENAQPALLTTSCALLSTLGERFSPALCAGHSLGEYTALVAAGALSFQAAVHLVRRRGELMRDAAAAQPGGMTAVLKLSAAQVDQICAEARGAQVLQPANFNAPDQVVISGAIPALLRAEKLVAERGGRFKRLPVSGAFHSALMEPAAKGLRQALAEVPLGNATPPVVANVNATPTTEARMLRSQLGDQLVHSVQWMASIQRMVAEGIDTFVEIGPGQILTGLVKRIHPTARRYNIQDMASARALLATLEE